MRESRSTPSVAVFVSRWLFLFAFLGEISPQEWLENSGVGNLFFRGHFGDTKKNMITLFTIKGRVWDVFWDVPPHPVCNSNHEDYDMLFG